jgi:hypothetical protein
MSKIKQTATNKPKAPEKKTMQPIEQKPALPAVQYDNPYLEAAAEAGGGFGKILKFVKGEYLVGEDTVPEGTECIAYLDQLARTWIKFEDGAIVDRRIELVANGKKLPTREELGDTDKNKWETDDEGNPLDPWVKQWLLPLVKVDDQDCMVFVSGSKGGNIAIGTLCGIYGRGDRKGLLPIIALKVRSYKHPKYDKIKTPDLPIVGWHGTPPLQTVTPTPDDGAADPNDEIPY